MNLLVLGGTRFVGRAVVLDALSRGWQVTALHRGVTGTLPFEVVHLTADRTDYVALAAALGDVSFDAVVDTWAGAPRVVRSAATLLQGRVGRLAYVCSLSVYVDGRPALGNESWATVEADPAADITDYAADKRGGELAALESFPDALLARAGMVLGPWENIGRLPWWLDRCSRGGRVVAPGRPESPLQYVDVRDLAAWTLDGLESGVTGPFDLTSPPGLHTMGGLLEAVVEATGSTAELVWIDQERVLAAGVEPWTQLPCWVPEGGEWTGFMTGDTTAAVATGLRSRPIAETVADAWAWVRADGMPVPPRDGPGPGLPASLEAVLLA